MARRWLAVGGRDLVCAGAVALLILAGPEAAAAQSLRGSPGTVERQNEAARRNDYTFLTDGKQVKKFVEEGYLVRVASNDDFQVKRMSYPYARPEVVLFLSRLGRQYRDACGEELVATSLTRPWSRQPRNASPRSVHPTGMAVDIRRSTNRYCREWLEDLLLYLEGQGVIEAVRERHPPHYHVAVFPKKYTTYVASLPPDAGENTRPSDDGRYRVREGDSLWTIARNHGVTVSEIRRVNDLRNNRIYPGQLLYLERDDSRQLGR